MSTARTPPVDLGDREAALAKRALAGDRDAFGELFALHERFLLNIVYRMTGSGEDAADITQEAFLRVFARLGSLQGRKVNLAAYLTTTARNLVYDRSVQRGRETAVADIALAAGADDALERDPERAALLADQQEQVRRANGELGERQRLALALREVEGQSYEEIGRVLDLAPDGVAQLLVRARMALNRALRLQQVDVSRLSPLCRSAVPAIGALIDGELGDDRREALEGHLAGCAHCRATKAAFEESRTSYRAWLPLLPLGLGTSVARAAEAQGLLPPSGSGPDGAEPGTSGGRRRTLRRMGVGALTLLAGIAALAIAPAVTSRDQDRESPSVTSTESGPDVAVSTTESVVRVADPPPVPSGAGPPASPSPVSPGGPAPPAPGPGTVTITPSDVRVVPRPQPSPAPPSPPPVVVAPAPPPPAAPAPPPPAPPPPAATPPPAPAPPPPASTPPSPPAGGPTIP
jgi:RNA polymerase sigma factor (sigma-70 family)